MREAVGSTFLFKLMIFFIFFFASFLAIAINYSQAFRMKNRIVNIIEQYQGLNTKSKNEIVDYVDSASYYRNITCDSSTDGIKIANTNGKEVNGLCVLTTEVKDNGNVNTIGTYYKVTTFVSFDFPIVGRIITIPVTGETKMIKNVTN